MEDTIDKISRDTFSSHMKSTLAIQQHLENMKITSDEKKMKSDFLPSKDVLQYAHKLPMSRRLSMYNCNRPLSPPKYFIVKRKKRTNKKKPYKTSSNTVINLSQKPSINITHSETKFSPPESPKSEPSPRLLKKWSIEENIETLVQMYNTPYEGDDEISTD